MFWTDLIARAIFAVKLDGSNLRTVVANLPNNPKDVVVHETERRIYWAEIGDKIRRANLDGTNVTTILNVPGLVTGLDIDSTANKLYWAEDNRIRRANTDGSGLQDLVSYPSATGALGLAVDVSGGKVYWYYGYLTNGPGIHRANLDGTGLETVITPTHGANRLVYDPSTGALFGAGFSVGIVRYNPDDTTVNLVQTGGFDLPLSLTVNPKMQEMYWTGYGGIYSAHTDGTEIVIVRDQLVNPSGLTIDRMASKLYWAEEPLHRIRRANLDGSLLEDVVTGIPVPSAVALDVSAGKLYWSELDDGNIQRSNLDGTNIENLIHYVTNFPLALALDPLAGKMYWTEPGIHRANLDGTQATQIVPSSVNPKNAISLMSASGNMYLYWTQDQSGGAKIRRSRLDGTGVEDVITLPGFDTITGLAFDCTLFSYSDFDQSGVVDLDDLGVVLNGFSDPLGFAQAELYPCYAGDGLVDLDDLIVLLESFAGNRPCADRCQ